MATSLFTGLTRALKDRQQTKKQIQAKKSTPSGNTCSDPVYNTKFESARQAYQTVPNRKQQIGSYKYRKNLSTPTIAVWVDDDMKQVMVGVRGTNVTDPTDLKSDFELARNQLKNTSRYQTDKKQFQKIQKTLPPSNYCYYVAGHSLGGAVTRQFLRDFWDNIEKAWGFNSALQFGDVIAPTPKMFYFYIKGDPLWSVSGRLLPKKFREVYEPKKGTKKKGRGALHAVTQFEGRGIQGGLAGAPEAVTGAPRGTAVDSGLTAQSFEPMLKFGQAVKQFGKQPKKQQKSEKNKLINYLRKHINPKLR